MDKPKVKLMRLTEEDKVYAQQDYIKRTYQQVKVSLDFPLRGWRREECLLKAQLEADKEAYEKAGIEVEIEKYS